MSYQPNNVKLLLFVLIFQQNSLVIDRKMLILHEKFNGIQFKTIQSMLISDKLKELREEAKQPQRRVAAALDIDTATYCKMEKGKYLPSREQISILADFYKCDKEELIKVWLANRIYDVAKDEDNAHAGLLAKVLLS